MPRASFASLIAKPIATRVVVAAVIGNALEFYDFLSYSFFAVYIGNAYFPTKTAFMTLLLSVFVFGVGFVFRPIGGLVIGAYADRAGRRAAMMLTIPLITLGTLGLAITPTYATIGIAAPIIIVFCRILQGFAIGGEVGPSSVFLLEAAPTKRRAFYVSWQIASQGAAMLTAGIVGMILALALSSEQLNAWGWRVPFLLCIIFVPVALYLRRVMPETLGSPTKIARTGRNRVTAHYRLILLAIPIVLGGTISTYVSIYMTTYAIATLGLSQKVAISGIAISGVAMSICALLGGWLADKIGRRPVMLYPRMALAILTWPSFWILTQRPSVGMLYVVIALLSGLTGASAAACLVVLPELLPKMVRVTSLAFAYTLGVTIFGGSTQFIVTLLIGATGDPTSPGWYVAFTSVICAAAIMAIPETLGRPLED